MKKVNDSMNEPLRFVSDTRTVGQFYNSKDKLYHLAEYVPYTGQPSSYLCGKNGNFSPSRKDRARLICAKCWASVGWPT
jgi:hypothetical protein